MVVLYQLSAESAPVEPVANYDASAAWHNLAVIDRLILRDNVKIAEVSSEVEKSIV